MKTIDRLRSATQRTTIITRDSTDPYGPRLIIDETIPLCVRAFPFSAIATMVASGVLATPSAYLLAGTSPAYGGAAVYVGETGNLGRRLQEHAGDEAKAFATEVFAIISPTDRLGRDGGHHFQKRMSDLAVEAGVARLVKGTNACKANVSPERACEFDRMLVQTLPLLIDAGCHYLTPGPQLVTSTIVPAASAPAVVPVAASDDDDGDDGGPMEIGVTTVPIGAEEQELAYGDLWARGYEHQGRFVVAAGSEMRKVTNPSADQHTVDRRNELISSGALVPINGLDDRYRLKEAVTFPTLPIAAKVLTGAHVGSEKWRPLPAAVPVIIAG
jgi:hypothetical protein